MADYALSFDGSNDYAYFENNSSVIIPNDTDFSVDFWMKWLWSTQAPAQRGLWTTDSLGSGGPSHALYVWPYSSNTAFGSYNKGNNFLTTTYSFVQDQWYHIYYGRTHADGVIYLGVDGAVQTATGTAGDLGASTTDIYLGNAYWGYSNVGIAEWRVSNVLRWTSNFTPPTAQYTADANTIQLIHFGENTGTACDDSGTNNYDLTVSGASWISGPGLDTGTGSASGYMTPNSKFW